MANLLVVDKPRNWPVSIPGVPLVSARSYLTDPDYSSQRGLKVFNLCRSHRYQSTGYYVSLLAMARGHRPLPSITTIQDMKMLSVARIVADDLDDLIQRSFRTLKSRKFTLSIYFGRNLARRYDEVSARLFRLFPVPLLRADFAHDKDEWKLQNIGAIAGGEIPLSHREFVAQAATEFFAQNRMPTARRATTQYDLAILVNPDEELPPSNKTALKKFAAAAKRNRLAVQFIEKEDFGRLAEFDALFIRETTQVNHHTYRFARRALAEGLVVIDDPDSIAKCTNKVYLAELLQRYKIPTPRTLIVHRDNRDQIASEIGLPCIIKLPDSAFSLGVKKAETLEKLDELVVAMLDKSDLIIAQAYMPSEFDWRIGVLDRQPLFACKYFMAEKHWQILKSEGGKTDEGDAYAVPVDLVPAPVVKSAVRAARLIGNGLYGVDLKQVGKKAYIIEINDNPNIDAGFEDGVLRNELYDRIMRLFIRRIQTRKNGSREADA